MFEASVDWVGLVVAGAAVALRLYLRESRMAEYADLEDWERQRAEDRKRVQQMVWDTRDVVLDTLLLHECGIQEDWRAVLRLAGLEPEQWIIGALADDRGIAEL